MNHDGTRRLIDEAVHEVGEQRTAMEKTLEALVEVSSWTGDKSGVDAAGAVYTQAMVVPCLRVLSESYGDHLVFHAPTRASDQGVVLIGHIDTVFPKKTFRGYRSEGDIAFGPGVLDMKGGLIVIAFALRALEAVGALDHIPLTVVVVTDEEVGSPDSAPLIRRVAQGAKVALGFESGRPHDEIVTRRKGTGSFTVHARGVSAHAGNNHAEGANAIWSLARFIDESQKLTNYPRGMTVNIGVIRGGMGKNTVPASAAAEGDLRFATHADEQELRASLVRLAEQCPLPRTQLEVEWGAGRPPMERSAASAALRDAYGACLRESGLGDGEMDLVGGGSDAATTAAMGIPSIDALGPRGKGYHTLDEYIEIPTLVSKTQALVRYLLRHHWRE